MSKLNVKKIAAWKGPGLLGDGGNLYLSGDGGSRKSWLFIYQSPVTKKQRSMGMGPADDVSLAEARDKATAARALLRNGLDPIEERKAEAERQKAAARTIPTFGSFADQYIIDHQPSWKNEKHRAQWVSTLRDHAAPLRAKLVNEITTEDVLGVLQPLWQATPETAARLRGRIEAILDSAKSKGLRNGENPARWRGHLAHILPKPRKLVRGHHRALPYEQIPAFMARLREDKDIGARLLEFTILTLARSNEARGCVWPELDLEKAAWTVPGKRMKAGREHRVPLCDRAIEIVRGLQGLDPALVFPGRLGKAFCENAMAKVIDRLGYGAVATAHGMRATFRTWVQDCTSFPGDLAEAALAHVIRDKTEAAYARGELFEKRRKLMTAWEAYCRGSQVIHLAARA